MRRLCWTAVLVAVALLHLGVRAKSTLDWGLRRTKKTSLPEAQPVMVSYDDDSFSFWDPRKVDNLQLNLTAVAAPALRAAPSYFAEGTLETGLAWLLPAPTWMTLRLGWLVRLVMSSQGPREFAVAAGSAFVLSPSVHVAVVAGFMRRLQHRTWRRLAFRAKLLRAVLQVRMRRRVPLLRGKETAAVRRIVEGAAHEVTALGGLFPMTVTQLHLVGHGASLTLDSVPESSMPPAASKRALLELDKALRTEFNGGVQRLIERKGKPRVSRKCRTNKAVKLLRFVRGIRAAKAPENIFKLHHISPFKVAGAELSNLYRGYLQEDALEERESDSKIWGGADEVDGLPYPRAVLIKRSNTVQQALAWDDMREMMRILRLWRWRRWVDLDTTGLEGQVAKVLAEAGNLKIELTKMQLLRDNLEAAGFLGKTWNVPEVITHPELGFLCSKDMIIMSALRGVSLSDKHVIGHALDFKEKGERQAWLNSLLKGFGSMVLVDGLFPCSPQPATLLYMNSGEVGMVEFGALAELHAYTRVALCNLYTALSDIAAGEAKGKEISNSDEERVRGALERCGIALDLPEDTSGVRDAEIALHDKASITL
ncbi:unnamed protein product [Chrysoparadoxa australica]